MCQKSRKIAKKCEKYEKKANLTLQDRKTGKKQSSSAGCAKPNLKELRSVNPLGETEGSTSNTLEGLATPAHCFRFAHPAEADWRLEARKIENLRKKSTPECLGTPENHPGREGLAVQVANVGSMDAQ